MNMITVQLENDRSVSINCGQILYVQDKPDDTCFVIMSAGDILPVKMSYLEVVGMLKAI